MTLIFWFATGKRQQGYWFFPPLSEIPEGSCCVCSQASKATVQSHGEHAQLLPGQQAAILTQKSSSFVTSRNIFGFICGEKRVALCVAGCFKH